MLMQGKGFIGLMGSASGTVKLKTAAAAGTWDLTLPTTAGTAGYFLQTNGSGVTTWAAGGSGGSGDVVGPSPATDNAIVRFDGATGKLIQNSNVLIADNGATSFTHTGSFRGLDQQQTLPLTGTAASQDSGYDGHNVFRITQDALTMAGGLGVSKGWTFTHEWGGTNATAGSINTGRIAMAVTAYQTGATTKVAGFQSSITEGMQIAAITTASSGGTGFGAAGTSGNVIGANIVVGLQGGAAFYRGLQGLEIDVATEPGCSADDRYGLTIGGGGLRGNSALDAAIGVFSSGDNVTSGWKNAILIHDPLNAGYGCLAPTGSVINTINQGTNTIATGIDLSGFFRLPGMLGSLRARRSTGPAHSYSRRRRRIQSSRPTQLH